LQLGVVVGTATATVKHPSLQGWRLIVVQPFNIDGRTPDGEPVLAVDGLGSAQGQKVLLSSDGASTRKLLNSDTTPVRWSVIGVQDD